MNPEPIQQTNQDTAFTRHFATHQSINSFDSITNGTVQQQTEIKMTGRFITEKDVIQSLPDTNFDFKVPEWITFLLLGGFVLLAILNFLHRKKLAQFFKASAAINYTHQIIREGNPFRKQASYLLILIYLIAVPLLFYVAVPYFIETSHVNTGIILYFELMVLFIGTFLYKVLFIQSTALVFQTRKASFELLANILIFNLLLGILILPIITLFIYTQQDILLVIAIIIYSTGIILRVFREFQVGMSRSIFSGLHLFLYLCTLEIIPVVIISKLVTNYYGL